MAKGKITSSKKKAEVLSEKIANPDLSLRDIEKETGVKKSTAKDILDKDMSKVRTSSDNMIELVDVNISIMTNGKKVINKIVEGLERGDSDIVINGMSDVRSLSSVLEDAFKQNQLLTGGVTDRVEIDELDSKQKRLIAERILKTKPNE